MKVTVIGIGFVGLVNAIGFAEKGHEVFALDPDKKKIAALRRNETTINENKLEEHLLKNVDNIRFTSEFRDAVYGATTLVVCNEVFEKEPGKCDLTGFFMTLKECCKHIQNDVVVVIRSTVPVGTNREVKDFMTNLTNHKYRIDVVSNPEFLSQGSAIKDMLQPARIVVGLTSRNAQLAMKELYGNFECPLLVVSPESAELIKYASNAYLAVKVSYINEIADLCETLKADIQEVSVGIGLDPRIGSKFLSSGIGFGGPWLTQDTRVIMQCAKEKNVKLRVLDAAMRANERRPSRLICKLKQVYGDDLSTKRFAILGLSYKGNTDDIRQSPANKVIDELMKEDCRIIAYDSTATSAFRKKMKSDQRIAYANTLDEALKTCDAAIFLNESKEFKALTNEEIVDYMKHPVVFDFKGVLNPYTLKDVEYYAIGKRTKKKKED